MTDDLLPLRGSPGSPYTRKMLALLRYRRIPYRYLQNDSEEFPQPKVKLIPVFYFRDAHGEYTAEVDSTPIIKRLETEYANRNVIPADPVIALINELLEDYGDEWLTKAMFHYRWFYTDDIEMAGAILPHYANVSESDQLMAERKKIFSERQISRLYVVGSNKTTAPVIEASYLRFSRHLNDHLKEFPFIMGLRPGSADFACFGQLTQLAQFDPTPATLTIKSFPRIHAWVSKMEDLSGLEPGNEDFVSSEQFPQSLKSLLSELGRTYVPVMLANARAIEQGLDTAETEVDGQKWQQEPFPYQAKCLQMLRIAHARLDPEDQDRLGEILNGSGCEQLFEHTKS